MKVVAAVLFLAVLCSCQDIIGDLKEVITGEDLKEVIETGVTVKDLIKKIKENGTTIEDVVSLVKSITKIGHVVFVQVKFLLQLSNSVKRENEFDYLKEHFALIHDKMDSLDYQFKDVMELIDWNTIKINLVEYEKSINAITKKFDDYTSASKSTRKVFEQIFLHSYRTHLKDAPLKIYIAIMKENSIFQDNLIPVVRKFFRNDYKLVTQFIAYMVRLMQKGINLQVAYYGLEERQDKVEELQRLWEDRLEELTKKFENLEVEMRSAWYLQHKRDVDLYVRTNSRLSNADMSKNLYATLVEKFNWRRWFVLVYTYTKSNDKDRYFTNCDGFMKLNIGNKVIVVNSIAMDKSSPRVDLKTFYKNIPKTVGKLSAKAKIAMILYQKTSATCEDITFRGAIEGKADIQINAPDDRLYVQIVSVTRHFHKGGKPYALIVFD